MLVLLKLDSFGDRHAIFQSMISKMWPDCSLTVTQNDGQSLDSTPSYFQAKPALPLPSSFYQKRRKPSEKSSGCVMEPLWNLCLKYSVYLPESRTVYS